MRPFSTANPYTGLHLSGFDSAADTSSCTCPLPSTIPVHVKLLPVCQRIPKVPQGFWAHQICSCTRVKQYTQCLLACGYYSWCLQSSAEVTTVVWLTTHSIYNCFKCCVKHANHLQLNSYFCCYCLGRKMFTFSTAVPKCSLTEPRQYGCRVFVLFFTRLHGRYVKSIRQLNPQPPLPSSVITRLAFRILKGRWQLNTRPSTLWRYYYEP